QENILVRRRIVLIIAIFRNYIRVNLFPPREVSSVTRLGQGAVARCWGAKTYTPPRQPKPNGPGAPAARHRGLLAACRTGGANRPGMPRPLKRWKGFLADEDGSLKGQSTGGRAEQ